MSERCVNCGGYEYPEIFRGETDRDMGCSCEGDFAPSWKRVYRETEGAYYYKNSDGEILSVPKS